MRIRSFLLAFCLILMLSLTAESYSPTANPSTTWTTNYSYEQPILRRETNVAVFTCGFFCQYNCTFYLFSIFISPTTESPGQSKVVWSVDYPLRLRENSILNFTAAGDLVLHDEYGFTVWSTNTAGKAVAGMNLTDTGNLVLFDHHNSVVWQSFDHPTDSLLPGQKLFQGQNLKPRSSSAPWREERYSLQVTDKGVFGYVESTPRQAYYSWFPYGNINTIKGRRYMRFLNGSLSFFIESSEQSDPIGVIEIPEASSAQYMKLMPDGLLKVFGWQLQEWKVIKDLTTVFQSYSYTADPSTTWDTNYTDVQPILLREANGAQFACGFLCEGNCTDESKSFHYIFSIFIFPAPNSSRYPESRVVWSANRDIPVGTDSILNFTAAGELVLRDVNGSTVWSTNTSGKSVVGMDLTDTGNLVLFDDQNSVVWQSFDHPTDCWLLGQKLFVGQKLTSTVVLSNQTNQEGMYSLQVTDKGLIAYVESNPPQPYYSRFGYLYGKPNTNKQRKYIRFLNGSLSFFIYASEPSYPDAEIYIPKASSTQFIKLMPDGRLKVFEWQSNSTEWTMVTDLTEGFVDECSYPLACRRNAICLANQQCGCPGTEYFRPVDDRQPNLGCIERTPLTCDSTKDQDFITLNNTKYFTSTADMEGVNVETCKQTCLRRCSCKAAFFRYNLNFSSGKCFLVSDLLTMKSIEQHDINALAFIKVQNVTSHRSSHQVATIVGSTIGSFVLLLVVTIWIITYVVCKRKRDAEKEEEYLDQFPGMPTRFSYEELKIATKDFTKKLGEGGFGSVFEGSLKDGSKIAVKCLEGLSHIKKSFLAEVHSIGSIHHVNLVRLRGFCTRKSKWFLVYDFMSNGSLDKWIYHGSREHILKWECRKKIILDIAKGLAYLHEDCRQKIIHLDIKPQNILLDNDFNAKVSDFGLSKLIDRNQTQVMTTMRGTPGYLAPEWLSSVITEKVDVYSFGIVLLEILCGRKNFDRSQPEESWHLLRVFQKCWEQETLLNIVDMTGEDLQKNGTEVMEMMKMASWCLQTDYARRPSMSSVVKVIEGAMSIESNLDYNFTDPRLQNNNCQEKDLTPLLPSILSGPR